MNDNSRIRPYLDTRIVILFERLREVQGQSIGKILTKLLHESDTFVNLLEKYYDASDEELNSTFLGLPINEEICENKIKKETKEN